MRCEIIDEDAVDEVKENRICRRFAGDFVKIDYKQLLMLLVGISAATAWFVYQQIMEVRSEVKAVRDTLMSLPPAFESKLERDVNAIVAGAKETATKAMSSVKLSDEDLLAAVRTNRLNLCKTNLPFAKSIV